MIGRDARWVVGALVLAAWCFVSGCATYKTATIPNEPVEDAADDNRNEVEIGSNVRIVLKSGKTASGKVVEYTATELTIKKKAAVGYRKFDILRSDIDTIELVSMRSGLKVALIGVGVVTVGIWLLFANLDIESN